jgi:hypothetical protein
MRNSCKLVKKLERLLKQLNCRGYLHHFGPKTYKLKQHVFALISMTIFRLSFRRVNFLLEMLGFRVPSYSALCKSRKRIPSTLFARLMTQSAGATHTCVAIDSTGFAQANPSYHFIKRIDRKKPIKNFIKQSSLFDTERRTFVALRVRAKPRHDLKDVSYLLKQVTPKTLLGDRAYDAEWLHEQCFGRGIHTNIKPKLWAQRGFYRRKQRKVFNPQLYGQRSLIEAGQGAIKRKYGGYTLAKHIRAIKAESYLKAFAFNLRLAT